MNPNQNDTENKIYEENPENYNKRIQSVPTPQKNIGVDLNSELYSNIIQMGLESKLDMSEINSLVQISERRNEIYKLLDVMTSDSTISAVLETYAEDATERNELGQIIWCESTDPDIQAFVTFLLDTMNVDKNAYKWVVALCKYGDVYLKLFRDSEYKDPLFNTDEEDTTSNTVNPVTGKQSLKEDVNINAFSKNDRYSHYVEMHKNPAEMFELVKLGKTAGYIKTNVPITETNNPYGSISNQVNKYYFKKSDVDIYEATEYVHGCLDDNSSRTSEEIDIFLDDNADEKPYTYTVRRGQSIFYSVFKAWRSLALLENSMLLNRMTKSSIVRVVNIEVGDMPKEMVGPQLQQIKQLIEQKTALNTATSMEEYTNPGPIENNIYIPTHSGVGAISTQQIGGDVDIKSIADVDYFNDVLFGALAIPKAYFGKTDDGAGFNGGQSLSIISSRYAKRIKRIQNVICQMVTDAVNLMLLDKGLDSYVNQYTIKMLPPTTQEDLDRQQSSQSKVQVINDIMNLLTDIQDETTKLKIVKALLSSTVTDPDVLQLIQDTIDDLEDGEQDTNESEEDTNEGFSSRGGFSSSQPLDFNQSIEDDIGGDEDLDLGGDVGESESSTEEETLPSPSDLNQNFAGYED